MINNKNTPNFNIEECFDLWSFKDFDRSVNFPLRTKELEKFGWRIDECGNAWKHDYYLTNNGKLTLSKEHFPLDFEDWINDPLIVKNHSVMYMELMTIINFN